MSFLNVLREAEWPNIGEAYIREEICEVAGSYKQHKRPVGPEEKGTGSVQFEMKGHRKTVEGR